MKSGIFLFFLKKLILYYGWFTYVQFPPKINGFNDWIKWNDCHPIFRPKATSTKLYPSCSFSVQNRNTYPHYLIIKYFLTPTVFSTWFHTNYNNILFQDSKLFLTKSQMLLLKQSVLVICNLKFTELMSGKSCQRSVIQSLTMRSSMMQMNRGGFPHGQELGPKFVTIATFEHTRPPDMNMAE